VIQYSQHFSTPPTRKTCR